MEIKDLNAYIHNYITNDRTHTAIMLTAPWGQGKSHYINNHLKEYLSKKNCDCVVISLYNLHDVSEISKSIYFQLRAIKIVKSKCSESEAKSTVKAAAKVIGKTLLNGLTSKIGFDFANLSDEDFQQVYESIDLSEKLIVLEDLERSGIAIIDVLGYVNTLTEQEGVKVLIVANEDEILKKKTVIEKDKEGKDVLKSQLDEKSLNYLKVKEKTISDTIQFECGFHESIGQIIDSFENSKLKKFDNSSDIQNILEIMFLCKCYNLRSFIFACQKTVDIFSFLQSSENEDFIKTIFFGILFLSFKIKSGETVKWDGGEEYSFTLACEQYPLFRFCFDYVIHHQLNEEKIEIAKNALKKIRLYDKRKTRKDEDIFVICNYPEHYEEEVKKAINSITYRLHNVDDISFYDYGSIVVNLISIKYRLGIDCNEARELLIENLRGRGNHINIEDIFRVSMFNVEQPLQAEFDAVYLDIKNALNTNRDIIQGFNYFPKQAEILYEYVKENNTSISYERCFLKKFNISQLLEMFDNCSPAQKNTIRKTFLSVYRDDTTHTYCYADDKVSMEELYAGIVNGKNCVTDKVQQLQYQWFAENLSDMLSNII